MKNINIDNTVIKVTPGEHYLTIKWGKVKLMIPNYNVPPEGVSLKWADDQLRNCIKSYPNLSTEDQSMGLCMVSLEALKDKYYEEHKHLTKRQLTDVLFELEVENTGLGVKLHLYETLSAGWPTAPLAE